MREGSDDFYLRYYVGHKGKFGHEFLEFEFKADGRLRYANNSQYKAENLIRKEGKSRALSFTDRHYCSVCEPNRTRRTEKDDSNLANTERRRQKLAAA